jgi:UDP-N-acetylmuramoyl-L-alanyl-D-glutamate--2,6-diaminopimelate ligase
MKLRDLFSGDAVVDARHNDVAVSGIAVDSRTVKTGDVFFALAGVKTDGARFIDQAIASGAAAVVSDRRPTDDERVPFIAVSNPRRALALAAARFYPRQPQTIAAVTGTSGKTSVAAFTRQIWQRLGHASASIGTIGLVSPKRTIYGSLTTPDPVALHRSLDELARHRLMALINIGSMVCASTRGPSRTSRATTWIITRRFSIILRRSCGYSRI